MNKNDLENKKDKTIELFDALTDLPDEQIKYQSSKDKKANNDKVLMHTDKSEEKSNDNIENNNETVIEFNDIKKRKSLRILEKCAIIIIILGLILVIFKLGNNKDDRIPAQTIEPTTKSEEKQTKEPDSTDLSEEAVERKGFYQEIEYDIDEVGGLDTTNITTQKVDMTKLKENYFVKLENDINWEIDLDGNGDVENVCLKFYNYGHNESYPVDEYAIYINNILYAIGSKGIEHFYIIDMDSSDDKYEILYNSFSDFAAVNYVAHGWDNGKFIENIFSWDANHTDEIDDEKFKEILNVDNTPGLIFRSDVSDIYDPFIMDVFYQYNSDDYTFEVVEKDEVGLSTNYFELNSKMTVYDNTDTNSRPYTIEPTLSTNQKVRFTKAKVKDGLITWIYIVNEDESMQGWAQYEIMEKFENDTGYAENVEELERHKRQDYINNNVIEMYFGEQLNYTAGY